MFITKSFYPVIMNVFYRINQHKCVTTVRVISLFNLLKLDIMKLNY